MGEPVGRPTDYKEEYNEKVFKFALLGLTDVQMADFFDIAESTFHKWKLDFPKFSESIKKGKHDADAEIANALYHRAKGYSHDEEVIKVVALGNNQGSEIERIDTIKHYPPDTAAAFIWLKNRQGANWKDRKEHMVDIGENADEYFKTIADAITQSDTNTGEVLP